MEKPAVLFLLPIILYEYTNNPVSIQQVIILMSPATKNWHTHFDVQKSTFFMLAY